ncbi:MAG: DUF4215 domain-containing protein [Polyangiaceae bacterium]
MNASTYGGANTACGPGCAAAPYCGGGVVSNGEQCDEGQAPERTTAATATAARACTLGPRCGDGIVNGSETCDSGAANSSTSSLPRRTALSSAGDGHLQPGEACDDWDAANIGGAAEVQPGLHALGPQCGDGFKNGTEQCDDGKNDGSYSTCKPDCTFALGNTAATARPTSARDV